LRHAFHSLSFGRHRQLPCCATRVLRERKGESVCADAKLQQQAPHKQLCDVQRGRGRKIAGENRNRGEFCHHACRVRAEIRMRQRTERSAEAHTSHMRRTPSGQGLACMYERSTSDARAGSYCARDGLKNGKTSRTCTSHGMCVGLVSCVRICVSDGATWVLYEGSRQKKPTASGTLNTEHIFKCNVPEM